MKQMFLITTALPLASLAAAPTNTTKAAAAAALKKEVAQYTVTITSSKDGTPQKAIFYCPPEAKSAPVPLLVALHSWSGDYKQGVEHMKHGQQRKWIVIAPDFRGPNNRPEACASDLAVQDVLDAVEYARHHACVDDERIYVVGGSGGGHMSLMMAARAPQLWAAVSAWCPITDLAAWHAESVTRKQRYAEMLEKCCGGPPGPLTEAEYRKRSPLFHLAAAKGLPLDINTGIYDGHTGSVPISHSLRAFNVLAGKDRQVSDDEIAFMVREHKVPPALAAEREDDPERQKPVLFRRVAGAARLTVFDGGHEIELSAALDWLSRQRRGAPANHCVGKGVSRPTAAQQVPK